MDGLEVALSGKTREGDQWENGGFPVGKKEVV
jgi:hypothetical protein